MKNIQPHQPSHLSPYAQACLDALVEANLAERISLGGALGLFHYLDDRLTHAVDAWWSVSQNVVKHDILRNSCLRMVRRYLVFKLPHVQPAWRNPFRLVGLMSRSKAWPTWWQARWLHWWNEARHVTSSTSTACARPDCCVLTSAGRCGAGGNCWPEAMWIYAAPVWQSKLTWNALSCTAPWSKFPI